MCPVSCIQMWVGFWASKSKQICLLEHTHTRVREHAYVHGCAHLPSRHVCMHVRTSTHTSAVWIWMHERSHADMRRAHLLSSRIYTDLPECLLGSTAPSHAMTSLGCYFYHKFKKRALFQKDIPWGTGLRRTTCRRIVLSSAAGLFIRLRPQADVHEHLLKLFNVFPYHTCSIWPVRW